MEFESAENEIIKKYRIIIIIMYFGKPFLSSFKLM
jgi:hypothetical protein